MTALHKDMQNISYVNSNGENPPKRAAWNVQLQIKSEKFRKLCSGS